MAIKIAFTNEVTGAELFSHTFTERQVEILAHVHTLDSLWGVVRNTMLVELARAKPRLMVEAVAKLEQFSVTPAAFTEQEILTAWLNHPEYMTKADKIAPKP